MKYWKTYGTTSNAFADEMKSILKEDRLCYAGRLDPMAQGYMLFLTGEDVSHMRFHLPHQKTYEFNMVLGISTESLDMVSIITEKELLQDNQEDRAFIERCLYAFIDGYTTQAYPMVSSYVMRQGGIRKPLWWYAKENIPVTPPIKEVTIVESKIGESVYVTPKQFAFDAILRCDTVLNDKTKRDLNICAVKEQYLEMLSENVATNKNKYVLCCPMKLRVSSGFYIRQFCADFGKYIGIPCIASDITRTEIHYDITSS